MKITIERKAFAEAVAWVAQALPKSHAAPSLFGIRLAAADGALTLQAFDYELGHTATIPCEVVTDGEALVSGRFLAMVVAGLKGADVDLVLEEPDLLVTAGRSSYRVRTMSVGEYPALPQFGGRVGTIDAEVLGDLIRVAGAPVDDNSPHEQALGVHFESDGDGTLWAVGSAGVNSVHVVTASWTPDGPLDATAPRSALIGAVKGMAGAVEIGREDGVLSLRSDGRAVTMRTYSAVYQRGQWRRVLAMAEGGIPVTAQADAGELLDAIKAAAALSGEGKDAAVKLLIEPGSISVESGSEHGEGCSVVDAEADEVAWVCLSANLVGHALVPLVGGPVHIGLPNPGEVAVKPLLLKHPDHDAARFVVMPRKWNGGAPR